MSIIKVSSPMVVMSKLESPKEPEKRNFAFVRFDDRDSVDKVVIQE